MTLSANSSTPAVENSSAITSVTLTPAGQSLLTIWCYQDNGTVGQSFTVSAAGLTFTKQADLQGFLEIWTAPVTTSTSYTINVTSSAGSTLKRVKAVVITDPTTGIPGVGNITSFAAGGGSSTNIDITSTAAGSMFFMTTLTNGASGMVAGETLIDSHGSASFSGFAEDTGLWRRNALSTGPGQLVNMVANTGTWDQIAIEITPGVSTGLPFLFTPPQRKQTSMIEGSLRFSYPVSETVWKDADGVWRHQETPSQDVLNEASLLLSVSGRPEVVSADIAAELVAAGIGTVEVIT